MKIGQPSTSSEARGLNDLDQRLTSSKARGLKNRSQPSTASEAIAYRSIESLSIFNLGRSEMPDVSLLT